MSESDGASGLGGGPQWARGVPPTILNDPAASAASPNRARTVSSAAAAGMLGPGPDRPSPTYRHLARSPLIYLGASAVTLAAAVVMVSWIGGFAEDRSPGNLWTYTFSLLAPLESLQSSGSARRNEAVVAVAIIAALVLLLWVGRLGRNVRGTGFGFFLGLAALPAWYTLPTIVGQEPAINRSYSVFVMRTAMTLIVLVAQYGLVRSTLLRRVWSAGHLPRSYLSGLLWLPALVPLAMFFASTLFTLILVGEDGRGSSAWVPTATMIDVATWADRLSSVAILVLLVVVSVVQHEGIATDQRADQQYRSR